jgi:hypothetical protein
MPSTMEFDIPSHALQVSLFGSKRQVMSANLFAGHFEQATPLRHIIPIRVLRDQIAIRSEGNQEDARTSSTLYDAFAAIRRTDCSSNNWLDGGLMAATPISQMSSIQLATRVVDALVDAGVVANADLAAAVEVAAVEIDVRKAMGDYWCSTCGHK